MLPASYGCPLETSPVLPEMGSWVVVSSVPQMALVTALLMLFRDSMVVVCCQVGWVKWIWVGQGRS